MNADHVINTVASEFDISVSDILSHDRHSPFPLARQIASFILSKKLGFSEIGRILNRDHSSIITNSRKVEETLKVDDGLKERLNKILKSLELPHDIIMIINHEQLKELKVLLEFFADGYKPKSDIDQLFKNNMVSIYEKVRKKVIFRKNNLTLNTNEQLAFRCFQQYLHLMPGIENFHYAENVCRTISNQINIDYG